MHNPPQESAMTEIALALAMGFFAIMVLTLISFGAPAARMAAVAVAPLAGNAGGVAETQSDDLIVIADGDRYLGADMVPLTPAAINAHAGRVVLAIDPAMPLRAVIERRGGLRARDLVVVILTAEWRAALADAKRVRQ